jgi:hypothetical protein
VVPDIQKGTTSMWPADWAARTAHPPVRARRDDGQNLARTDTGVECLRTRGFTVTVVDYPDGLHGYSVVQNTERSREVLARINEFFRASLIAGA